MNIQIYGYFQNAASSVPIICCNWARELSKYHNVKVCDFLNNRDYRFDISHLMGEHDTPAEMAIYFGYPSFQQASGVLVNKHKYKVGVFFCETDLSPKERMYVNMVKWTRIVVPSIFCENIYKHLEKTMIVRHGVNDKFFIPTQTEKKKQFTFLFVFSSSVLDNSMLRKNVRNLLSGFKLFLEEKNANLIIKTTSTLQEIIDEPNVVVIKRYMTVNELRDLYRSCHVYVNPSLAEGFGLTVVEAMACGLPIVSPIHTGLTEFLRSDNCIAIPHLDRQELYTCTVNRGMIGSVSAENICSALLIAHNSYDKIAAEAVKRVGEIKRYFSWSAALAPFLGWIRTLEGK